MLEFLANLDVDTAQTFQRQTMASAWPLLKLAAQKRHFLVLKKNIKMFLLVLVVGKLFHLVHGI